MSKEVDHLLSLFQQQHPRAMQDAEVRFEQMMSEMATRGDIKGLTNVAMKAFVLKEVLESMTKFVVTMQTHPSAALKEQPDEAVALINEANALLQLLKQ